MTPWTWKRLMNIPHYSYAATLSFLEEYELAGALALSVAKWHPDNPNRGFGYCGLCLFYRGEESYPCDGCPLRALWNGVTCNEPGSPWWRWTKWSKTLDKPLADRIFNDLVGLYDSEYRRINGEKPCEPR